MTWKEKQLSYLADKLEETETQLDELREAISEKRQELLALELKDAYLNLIIKALETEIEELKESEK